MLESPSCDMKWLFQSEMPRHATRNDFSNRKYGFMRHEMTFPIGNAISCDMK